LPGLGLDDSLGDWPISGSMRNGVVYERPMSVPRTSASGPLSWPTPMSRDYRSPDRESSGNFQRKVAKGYTIDLNSRAANWPTPTVGDSASTRAANYTTDSGRHSGTTLTDAMADWPGPPDQRETGAGSLHGVGLHWATPQASDTVTGARTAPESPQVCLGRDLSRQGHDPKRLNPAFVEWLMGFPSFWSLPCDTEPTDSAASETR
jgi:hypothetical protein